MNLPECTLITAITLELWGFVQTEYELKTMLETSYDIDNYNVSNAIECIEF